MVCPVALPKYPAKHFPEQLRWFNPKESPYVPSGHSSQAKSPALEVKNGRYVCGKVTAVGGIIPVVSKCGLES